jgi:hypothetical protein
MQASAVLSRRMEDDVELNDDGMLFAVANCSREAAGNG